MVQKIFNEKRFFFLRGKGLNNVDVAKVMKLRRETVQFYCKKFRAMTEAEFKEVYKK